jgi:hypothetical protein
MIFYTMVDAEGNIVRRTYTTNKNAAVYEGHRLLPDILPSLPTPQHRIVLIEPTPKNADKIMYEVVYGPVQQNSDAVDSSGK